jgi:predicted metal-dependent phosphoesterase TrpH
MKCDLHVHSLHSGTLPVAILRHFFLESYSAPRDVYSTLRARGMDLVTLTDHDSISGAEELRRYPDFFVSEEVTCTMPSGTQAHVGVYDITERQHIEINRRRNDMVRLLAYLSEQRLFFTVTHVFSSLTGRRDADDYEWFSGYFPAVEARNGQMLTSANQHAAEFAWKRCKTQVAGSDAHALASVGTTYTEVPGARNKDEFFAGLRAGHGCLCGESGGYWKLTRDIVLLCGEMIRKDPWTAMLSPLVALVPAGVAVDYFIDLVFVRRWGTAVNGPPFRPAPKPIFGGAAGARETIGVGLS